MSVNDTTPINLPVLYSFSKCAGVGDAEQLLGLWGGGIVVDGDCGWEGEGPVSYTHLDVYKRQWLYW